MSTFLPGLIDIHVHLRDPGQTHKEDFYTGAASALAGGFTTILDMPNNATPITTYERLEEKITHAREKTVCDIGFYFGSLGDNLKEFEKVKNMVFGIKLFLNETTGNYLIDESCLTKIYHAWPDEKPILVHAEQDAVDMVIQVVRDTKKKTHVCHVATARDLEKILQAKKDGLLITCGVTPHHLFLTELDGERLGPLGIMKPPLQSEQDVEFLWNNLKNIDVIESDHAPHTLEEKQSEGPPYGVPGLDTTLPLLLTAVSVGKLTLEEIIRLCHTNPKNIFNIPTDDSTKVEIDMEEEYEFHRSMVHSKCGWSPFEGRKMKGKVKRVFLRGVQVVEDDTILVKQGSGRIL